VVAWRWVSERAWEAEEVEAGLKVWAGSDLRRVLTRRPATVRVVGVEGGNDGEVERGWGDEGSGDGGNEGETAVDAVSGGEGGNVDEESEEVTRDTVVDKGDRVTGLHGTWSGFMVLGMWTSCCGSCTDCT